MDFIEKLKSVGGVKRCAFEKCGRTVGAGCQFCYGTGQILDLAPLLAKPKVLENIVREAWVREWVDFFKNFSTDGNLCVIGPQRASNLVYEVARQLGGSAVVMESHWHKIDKMENIGNDEEDHAVTVVPYTYRLSLPIPLDATILFVTDRVDEKEMNQIIIACEEQEVGPLGYVLALVSDRDTLDVTEAVGEGTEPLKVISLHKEK
jgi:hypothetical protein